MLKKAMLGEEIMESRTIWGSKTFSNWSNATCLTVYTIDWERIQDPMAPKVGRYSVNKAYLLTGEQLQEWRLNIGSADSWMLDKQTRHRPTPTHLLLIDSAEGSMVAFYALHARQLGYEIEGQQIYEDCSDEFVQRIQRWISPRNEQEGA